MQHVADLAVTHRHPRGLQLIEHHRVTRFGGIAAWFDEDPYRDLRFEPSDDGIGDDGIRHFLHADIETDRLAADVGEKALAAVHEPCFADLIGGGRTGRGERCDRKRDATQGGRRSPHRLCSRVAGAAAIEVPAKTHAICSRAVGNSCGGVAGARDFVVGV